MNCTARLTNTCAMTRSMRAISSTTGRISTLTAGRRIRRSNSICSAAHSAAPSSSGGATAIFSSAATKASGRTRSRLARATNFRTGTRAERATALSEHHERVLAQLRALPGVTGAGATNSLPYGRAQIERRKADLVIKGRSSEELKHQVSLESSSSDERACLPALFLHSLKTADYASSIRHKLPA